jgi:hypothetical protein
MKFDWKRFILQILATIAGGMGFLNLGRLTVPDVGAGPADLAGWVGVPALAAVAGLVGQHFLRTPAADGKPGSPGHAEFCQSVYELAKSLELDRLTALVEAWRKTAPPEPKP